MAMAGADVMNVDNMDKMDIMTRDLLMLSLLLILGLNRTMEEMAMDMEEMVTMDRARSSKEENLASWWWRVTKTPRAT